MIHPLLTLGLLARALFAVLNSPSGDVRRNSSIGVGCTGIIKYVVERPDIASKSAPAEQDGEAQGTRTPS